MGQNAPHYQLEKRPPLREKVETIEILRQTRKFKIRNLTAFSRALVVINGAVGC